MGELSPWHWIIVLLIFALLFGSKKLPDAARGLGRSMRIFKSEMSSTDDGATAKGAAAVSSVIASTTPVTPSPAPEASATPEPAPVEDAVPPAVTPIVTPEPVKQD